MSVKHQAGDNLSTSSTGCYCWHFRLVVSGVMSSLISYLTHHWSSYMGFTLWMDSESKMTHFFIIQWIYYYSYMCDWSHDSTIIMIAQNIIYLEFTWLNSHISELHLILCSATPNSPSIKHIWGLFLLHFRFTTCNTMTDGKFATNPDMLIAMSARIDIPNAMPAREQDKYSYLPGQKQQE